MRINNKKGGTLFYPEEEPDRLIQHLIDAQSINPDEHRGILIELLRDWFSELMETDMFPENLTFGEYKRYIEENELIPKIINIVLDEGERYMTHGGIPEGERERNQRMRDNIIQAWIPYPRPDLLTFLLGGKRKSRKTRKNKKGGTLFNPEDDPDRLLQHLIDAQRTDRTNHRQFLIDYLRKHIEIQVGEVDDYTYEDWIQLVTDFMDDTKNAYPPITMTIYDCLLDWTTLPFPVLNIVNGDYYTGEDIGNPINARQRRRKRREIARRHELLKDAWIPYPRPDLLTFLLGGKRKSRKSKKHNKKSRKGKNNKRISKKRLRRFIGGNCNYGTGPEWYCSKDYNNKSNCN